MSRKQIAAATALTLVVLTVFGWSVVMAAMGHAALIAAIAPVLGLTVAQVMRGARPRTARDSRHLLQEVAGKEDDAP
ncbi:hypothetical protein [Streptomyces sp. NPDC090093]|uniref:hypothetical protein n=1 Tax=Streptomyces sp. NPDC090093 TaxID=3365945 RepID=UPI0037F3DCE0